MANFVPQNTNQNQIVKDAQQRAHHAGPQMTTNTLFAPQGRPEAVTNLGAPQHAPVAQPQPPPGQEGWVNVGNGAWVPPDNPLAKPTAQAAQPGATTNQQPGAPTYPPFAIPPSPAIPSLPSITPPKPVTLGQAAPAPTAPQPVTAPTYQTYTFTGAGVNAPAAQGLISPATVAQYSAGAVPQYQPSVAVSPLTTLAGSLAGQRPQITAPTYQPGQLGQYQAPSAAVNPLTARAGALAGQQQQVTAPAYQATQIGQYQGGGAQPFINQAAQVAGNALALTAPQYQAGQVSPFQAAGTIGLTDQAQQAFQQVLAGARPDVAGQKEASKEQLLALQQQQLDALRQRAALSGRTGAGEFLATEANLGDQFSGNLTRSYRDIDQAAQDREIANLLAGGGALQNLAAQQGAEGRSNYATGLQGTALEGNLQQAATALGLNRDQLNAALQSQQFGQQTALAGLAGGEGRADFAAGLQGQLAQEDLRQAATALGLNTDQVAAALQQQQFGQTTSLADLLSGQARADYSTGLQGQLSQENLAQTATALGLNVDQLQAALQQQQFGQATSLSDLLSSQARADYSTGLQGKSLEESLKQAGVESGRAAAQYGLSRDQLGLQQQQQGFGQQLAAAQFSQQQQQTQADEQARAFQASLQGADFQRQQQEAQAGRDQAAWAALLGRDVDAANIGLQGNAQNLAFQQADVQRGVAQAGLGQQSRQQDLAEILGIGGMNEQQRQFNEQNKLAQQIASQQNALGQGGLDLQKLLGQGGLDLQKLQTLLQNQQFGQQLAQQGSQFGQNLNLQGSVAANNANTDLLRLILGY